MFISICVLRVLYYLQLTKKLVGSISCKSLQLEKAFQHLRKLEEETRKAEAQRREQDRLEAAKRKEMQRITNVN